MKDGRRAGRDGAPDAKGMIDLAALDDDGAGLRAAAHPGLGRPHALRGRLVEIARLLNRFQEKCAGNVAATYTLRDDGKVTVVNECRKADGTTTRAEGLARRADANGPASRLEVRFAPAFLSFLPFVWGDYWIVALDRDYRWAVVGEPSRKYLWILSRTRTLDAAVYDRLLAEAVGMGFDVSRVRKTAQNGT